jgi:hypothetical protein
MASLVERFEREELPHLRKFNAWLKHGSSVPPRN